MACNYYTRSWWRRIFGNEEDRYAVMRRGLGASEAASQLWRAANGFPGGRGRETSSAPAGRPAFGAAASRSEMGRAKVSSAWRLIALRLAPSRFGRGSWRRMEMA